jgi:hypothetical protein
MKELDLAPRFGDSPVEHVEGADSQALVELAQELTLVTRALHVQLLSGSAPRALTGLSGMAIDAARPPGPGERADDWAATVLDETVAVPVVDVSLPVQGAFPRPPGAVASALSPEVDAAPPASPPPEQPVRQVASVPLPQIVAMDAIELLEVPIAEEPGMELPVIEVSVIPSSQPTKPDHRSQAMLAEIGFLDEETTVS